MSEESQKASAKAAFAAIYSENPAEFNTIAQEAIKNAVREKIRTIRGEIRDEMTDRLLVKDSDKPSGDVPIRRG